MPIPFILAGAALLAGGYGVKKGLDAKRDFSDASDTNDGANRIYDRARSALEEVRKSTQEEIEALGSIKIKAYDDALVPFYETFSKVKNFEFSTEVKNDEFVFTKEQLAQLASSVNYMNPILASGATSLGAGGLAGLAAYGGAGLLAAASTGTPIAALSGVAATNATLAWFGGGALSAGGLGMAGGTAVLGGIVAGPVLAIGGMMLASKAEAAKHAAYENLAKARAAAEEMKGAEVVAGGIGESFKHVRLVIDELLGRFGPMLQGMEAAVSVNPDYASHTRETQKGMYMTCELASAIARLVEMRLLSDEGTIIEGVIGKLDADRDRIVDKLA